MKLFLLAFVLFITAFSAIAENKIIDPQTCFINSFQNYNEWLKMHGNVGNKQFLNYFPERKFVERKSTLECVDFVYQVDGLTIEGYYLKPKHIKADSLPVVIFNRGGNGGFGYVSFEQKMGFISDIATKGYIVVGSQYRGSGGMFFTDNGKDEFGGKDVNDVLALLPLLKEIPKADHSNVALLGWSRGVMQSYLVAKQMPNVKAIVAIAGVSDVQAGLRLRPKMEKMYKARIPNFELNREEELRKRSVIKWISQLPKSPILLIHGAKDKRVNVEQSKSLAHALAAKSHPYKLVIYPNDTHGLMKNRDKLVVEIHSWLKRYLPRN